ncbi:zinc metalloprotease [Actinomadura sp. WMMB 499]|uniref:zinc metalloprotease n=1 Tax=Actinomadura sp. WMMB 499 TaxID=1219491 RepID=UPI0020C7C42D|nr:zinc metalloprotease [Actinomadura sp. WMMB 499]
MKLLAAAAALAALVPAVPAAAPAAVTPPGPARAAAAGQRHAAPHDCVPANARLRPGPDGHGHGHGGHGHGKGHAELSPAQSESVESDLGRILDGLGLTLGPKAPQDANAAERRAAARITVPVYFHVLHDGSRGNVSDATVRRQINVMNAAYGGRYGGDNTEVSFRLRAITRSDNSAWFRYPEQYEGSYKPRLRKGGKGTLNLYSAYIEGDLLGWSTFPWKYRDEPKMDGVTINYGSMPGGHIDQFNRGFSAAHETGHWLGLYHTFQDGCGGHGDRVADTPAESRPADGCPEGKDTCPQPGEDPIHNFMNYSYDTCMTSFTNGQGDRMHKVWAAYRR